MYEVIEELSNWLKKIENEEWKYNFINEKWELLSEQ